MARDTNEMDDAFKKWFVRAQRNQQVDVGRAFRAGWDARVVEQHPESVDPPEPETTLEPTRDGLTEIESKREWFVAYYDGPNNMVTDAEGDVEWLIAEVKRLRQSHVAQDQPPEQT